MTDLLVGIDVGTSACKAAVVDESGRELAHGKTPTPWRQVPTGAEVDPEALFEAAVEAAAAAIAAAPEGRVRGIGDDATQCPRASPVPPRASPRGSGAIRC